MYDQIDPAKLRVFPLASRQSFIDIVREAADPDAPAPAAGAADGQIARLAERIAAAREAGASVMLTYGAHLIKNGGGTLLYRLVERGWVTHLATQGAGVIHDWEFAFLGRSSEAVRDNAPVGRFGTWDETGKWINLAVIAGAAEGLGFGEAVGRLVARECFELPTRQELRERIAADPANALAGARADLLWTMERFDLPAGRIEVKHPFKRYSVLAACYEKHVPVTVHPGIGYDIIVNHPMFHGGAIGRAAGTDTRIFAHSVDKLDGGVYLSLGSAIMSPQVFEKALSAANNLRQSAGRPFISKHHIAVVDLADGGGWDWSSGEPPKDNPAYYLRYCKTFARMGGTLDYVQCDHRVVLAGLVRRLG